jgi:hypothetical protein
MDQAKPLPILFRMFRGELCAYFPTEEWAPGQVTSYAHIGQHGGADRSWLRRGRRATPEQYAPLLAELRGIYETGDDEHVPLRVYQRDPSRALRRKP